MNRLRNFALLLFSIFLLSGCHIAYKNQRCKVVTEIDGIHTQYFISDIEVVDQVVKTSILDTFIGYDTFKIEKKILKHKYNGKYYDFFSRAGFAKGDTTKIIFEDTSYAGSYNMYVPKGKECCTYEDTVYIFDVFLIYMGGIAGEAIYWIHPSYGLIKYELYTGIVTRETGKLKEKSKCFTRRMKKLGL